MATKKRSPQSARIIDLLPSWVREMKAKHRTEGTIKGYVQRLRYFCAWLSEDGDPEHCTVCVHEVSKEMLQTYFAELYATVSQNTVVSRHIALSSFMKFCIGYDELESDFNPVRRYVKQPAVKVNLTEILDDTQIRALLATCEKGKDFRAKRDYAIIRTFLATGMRLAELSGLQTTDIDLDHGIITIQRRKGGDPGVVAIGPRVVRALDQYIHKRLTQRDAHLKPLWLGRQGVLTYEGVRHAVQIRAREAGLKIHPHQFRHLFAHGYLADGGQESALLTLAGWKDPKMLHERYGKSLASERAINEHHRLGIGEKW